MPPSIATFDATVTAMLPKWERVRDFLEGQDAVKAKTTKYLRRLPGQQPVPVENVGLVDPYAIYLDLAKCYGASARTRQGLLGMLFRKPPHVTVPDAVVPLLADITATGLSFERFAEQIAAELLGPGRCGMLVDMPDDAAAGARPYLCRYVAETIDLPRVRRVDGRQVLRLVKLRECQTIEDEETGVHLRTEEQIRVLRLVAEGTADATAPLGWYRQDVWHEHEQPGAGLVWTLDATTEPTRRGERLPFVPFVMICADSLDPTALSKPPLLDMIDVNLSHYRKSADYGWGLHFCGVPTPIAAGFPMGSSLSIGASEAWISDNPNARGMFMEFTGQGLNPLRQALEDDKLEMAILGARLLRPERTGMETAEAARIAQAGDAAVLTSIATLLSAALTDALVMLSWWAIPGSRMEDIRPQVSVAINRDFLPEQMSPQELVQLWTVWQGGGISTESYVWNLAQGEMLPPGRSLDEERAELGKTSDAIDAAGTLPAPDTMPAADMMA